jgi:hypothetical protein
MTYLNGAKTSFYYGSFVIYLIKYSRLFASLSRFAAMRGLQDLDHFDTTAKRSVGFPLISLKGNFHA